MRQQCRSRGRVLLNVNKPAKRWPSARASSQTGSCSEQSRAEAHHDQPSIEASALHVVLFLSLHRRIALLTGYYPDISRSTFKTELSSTTSDKMVREDLIEGAVTCMSAPYSTTSSSMLTSSSPPRSLRRFRTPRTTHRLPPLQEPHPRRDRCVDSPRRHISNLIASHTAIPTAIPTTAITICLPTAATLLGPAATT